MPSTPSHAPLLTAWLCASLTLGCPAAQVKPPGRMSCPKPAKEAMLKDLRLIEPGVSMNVLVDVSQPGMGNEVGLYRQGPLISRVSFSMKGLPLGTLLYGYLWTTPGLVTQFGKEAVTVRYHEALLPDGRKYPVCMVLGSDPFSARVQKLPGSTPELARLYRDYGVITAVGGFPP